MKREFVMKLRALMKDRGIGVNALQRMLDPEDISISLKSIAKLLAVFGTAGQIVLEPKRSKKQAA